MIQNFPALLTALCFKSINKKIIYCSLEEMLLKARILQNPMTDKHKQTGNAALMIHMIDLVLLLALLYARTMIGLLTITQLRQD